MAKKKEEKVVKEEAVKVVTKKKISVKMGPEELEMLHYLLVKNGTNCSDAVRAGLKMLYESEVKKEKKKVKK